MTWNSAAAPSAGRGRYPSSSMISSRGPASDRMQVAQRPSRAARWQRATNSAAVTKLTRWPASTARWPSASARWVLPTPGWADQQAVGVLVDEPQGGEFADQLAVDAGLGVEVEVLQPPGGGEGGKPQPA